MAETIQQGSGPVNSVHEAVYEPTLTMAESISKVFLLVRLAVCVIIPALISTPFVYIRDLIFNSNLQSLSQSQSFISQNGNPNVMTNGNSDQSTNKSKVAAPDPAKSIALVAFEEGGKLEECAIVTAAQSPDYLGGIPRRIILSAVACFGYVSNMFNDVKMHNLETLFELIHNRPAGQPLITISNHTSSLDDPLMWCIWKLCCSDSRILRWTLTARDVCFTNPYNSFFFRLGKCIPLDRFGGIHQDGMLEAIQVLNRGEWLHVFPEGRLIQDCSPVDRLKWGISSLIARCSKKPTLLCIGINGLQDVIPEKFIGGKRTPVPLWGKSVSFVVGEPFELDVDNLRSEATFAVKTGDKSFGADCFKPSPPGPVSTPSDVDVTDEKKKQEKILAVGDEVTRRLYSEIAFRIQEKLAPLTQKAIEFVKERK